MLAPTRASHTRLTSLAVQSSEALEQERPGWVGLSVKMMGDAPTSPPAKVTDPAGKCSVHQQRRGR